MNSGSNISLIYFSDIRYNLGIEILHLVYVDFFYLCSLDFWAVLTGVQIQNPSRT